MTYRGTVQNGVVVLDQPSKLPEGTVVEVIPTAEARPSLLERLQDVVGKAEGLPRDLAAEHDHYLHGTAKRSQP